MSFWSIPEWIPRRFIQARMYACKALASIELAGVGCMAFDAGISATTADEAQ
jgi:hypothetical protein